MKPYYQDERVTLYNGDALETMREMEAGSVDVVITDPPYDERTHKGAITERVGGKKFNNIDFGFLPDPSELVIEFLRVSRRWNLAFCTFEDMKKWRDPAWELEAWVRAGVWDRVNAAPQFTGDRPSQGADGIAIFHNPNIKKRWNGGGKQGIWRHSVENGKKLHPTQKPLSLMSELVAQFSDPGELILDPFCGGGSTLVAALELGRRAIGVDSSEAYCEIARKRILAARVPLFVG